MIIANPIYDAVFKYLLDDNEIAKAFIGTIIDENIVELTARPQEISVRAIENYSIEQMGVMRLDFNATIRTESGELKKVLIELQKGKKATDFFRFRRYLAEQMIQQDQILNEYGEYVTTDLPIVTIYFLGFKLNNVPTGALKVQREYYDLIGQKVLPGVKNEFVEILTHDCYIVQIPLLPEKAQTKLDYFLSIFDQSHTFERNRLIEYPFEPEDPILQKILKRLSYVAASPEIRKIIDLQESLENKITAELNDALRVIEANKQQLAEKDTALAEKDSALAEKDSALAENTKALEDQRIANQELQRQLAEMKALLNKQNPPNL